MTSAHTGFSTKAILISSDPEKVTPSLRSTPISRATGIGGDKAVLLYSMDSEQRPTDIPFDCPLCGSNQCLSVVVPRPNGDYYTTRFYKCAGCTAMFLDPDRFSKEVRYTFDPQRSWSEEKPMRHDATGHKTPHP